MDERAFAVAEGKKVILLVEEGIKEMGEYRVMLSI